MYYNVYMSKINRGKFSRFPEHHWVASSMIYAFYSTKFPCVSTNQKHYLDLGSDASSVWNFCARYSDVVLRGLKWRLRETSAVFSGYLFDNVFSIECIVPVKPLLKLVLPAWSISEIPSPLSSPPASGGKRSAVRTQQSIKYTMLTPDR